MFLRERVFLPRFGRVGPAYDDAAAERWDGCPPRYRNLKAAVLPLAQGMRVLLLLLERRPITIFIAVGSRGLHVSMYLRVPSPLEQSDTGHSLSTPSLHVHVEGRPTAGSDHRQ